MNNLEYANTILLLEDENKFLELDNEIKLKKYNIEFFSTLNKKNIKKIRNILLTKGNADKSIKFLENNTYIYLYNILLVSSINNKIEIQKYKTKYEILYEILMVNIQDKHSVVIFGTETAGKIAYNICTYLNIKIKYFIDDNKIGIMNDIEIINREQLESINSDFIDYVITGPFQKGLDLNNQLSGIPIFKIQDIFVEEELWNH